MGEGGHGGCGHVTTDAGEDLKLPPPFSDQECEWPGLRREKKSEYHQVPNDVPGLVLSVHSKS